MLRAKLESCFSSPTWEQSGQLTDLPEWGSGQVKDRNSGMWSEAGTDESQIISPFSSTCDDDFEYRNKGKSYFSCPLFFQAPWIQNSKTRKETKRKTCVPRQLPGLLSISGIWSCIYVAWFSFINDPVIILKLSTNNTHFKSLPTLPILSLLYVKSQKDSNTLYKVTSENDLAKSHMTLCGLNIKAVSLNM